MFADYLYSTYKSIVNIAREKNISNVNPLYETYCFSGLEIWIPKTGKQFIDIRQLSPMLATSDSGANYLEPFFFDCRSDFFLKVFSRSQGIHVSTSAAAGNFGA